MYQSYCPIIQLVFVHLIRKIEEQVLEKYFLGELFLAPNGWRLPI